MRRFCLTFLILISSASTRSFGQNLKGKKGSVVKKNIQKEKVHPRVALLKKVKKDQQKAMLLGMLIPCGGQIFNKSYYTAGVFAGMYSLAGWFTWYWHKRYIDAGLSGLDDTETSNSGEVRGCERFRTMGLISLGVIYIAGIIEAYSTASLKSFDISDDLSFVIEPKVKNDEAGISLGLNFK
jgi:hypothetical protein